MSGARVVAVTYDTLAAVHRRTATTTFWELDPLDDAYTGAYPEADKAAWLASRALEQGVVGFSIVRSAVESTATEGAFATALFCPAADAPGAVRMPTAPISRDAWVVTSLHIDSAAQGRGWESVLLDAVIMAALERGVQALEMFGVVPGGEATSEMCAGIVRRAPEIGLVEVPVLESAGFMVVRDHPVLPRLRIDLPPAHDLLSARDMAELLAEVPAAR